MKKAYKPEEVTSLFLEYLHAGDLEGSLSLFEDDAVVAPNVGAPEIRGKENIRQFYTADARWPKSLWGLSPHRPAGSTSPWLRVNRRSPTPRNWREAKKLRIGCGAKAQPWSASSKGLVSTMNQMQGRVFGLILYLTLSRTLPRLGATAAVSLIIFGQLLMGMLIDHFGWFGVSLQPISGVRLIAVILLLAGAYLMVR